jgi:hypothetical protein
MSAREIDQSERQLMHLLDQALGGSQTDAESEQLGRLLDEHEELRAAVIEQLQVHSLLQWELVNAAPNEAAYSQSLTFEDSPALDSGRNATALNRAYFRHWKLAAALLLAMGAALFARTVKFQPSNS